MVANVTFEKDCVVSIISEKNDSPPFIVDHVIIIISEYVTD